MFSTLVSVSIMSPIPLPSLSVLQTFLIVVACMLVKKIMASNSKPENSTLNRRLPPGPWKLPLVGNLHNLLGSLLPHHTLRDLAVKYGPIMHLRLGQVSTVVVSSADVAREVMRTHDVCFADRPQNMLVCKIIAYGGTDVVFSRYGDYWRQLRRICTVELLSARRVQLFRSVREEEVSCFINQIADLHAGSEVNLSERLSALGYSMTARAAFGRKSKHQEAFKSAVDEGLRLAAASNVADMYPSYQFLHVISGAKGKAERVQRTIDMVLENIVNEHREIRRQKTSNTGGEEVGEDLVDVLLDQEGTHFNNDCIKAVLLDIFSGGSETTSTTIEWAMSELVRNPNVMKKAQAEVRKVFERKENPDETKLHELTYLEAVINETLRLHPPAPLLLPRECRESCKINGYEIPLETRIIVNAWAIGRDPKNWVNAEIFLPERFIDSQVNFNGSNFEYIPFGSGRRICPGIKFAMANMKLPLAQLLFHFDWKLPNEEKHETLDMTEAFGIIARRKLDLRLISTPSLS